MNKKYTKPDNQSFVVERNKNQLTIALKILVTVSLFAILFTYVGFQETLEKFNSLGIVSAIWILILLTLQQFLSGFRWGLILRNIGETHDLDRILQFFMAGAIANSLLINSLAGLSVRVLLLSRAGTSLKRAIYSLAFEKLFASLTLLICFVAGMALLMNVSDAELAEKFRLVMYLGIGVLALIAIGLPFLARLRIEKASELLDMIRSAVTQPNVFAVILMQSILIIATGFYSVAVIATGLDVEVSLLYIIAIQPGIAIMSALPLSLGGWGVREVSMVVGLGMLGVAANDALAISLTYGLLGILATFIAAGISLLLRVRTVEDSER